MDTTPLIDLEPIAKQLKLPLPSVQRTAELLEEGNTVPFVTRFRKDQTGGLDEQQIRAVEKEITRVKLLSERKETILKSIESRGQLTPELAAEIRKARTLRAAEDIYLPFKPKKQSLAAVARSRGLEPLALEVVAGAPTSADLAARAAELVSTEKDLPDVEAVLEGIRHLVAEHFGNSVKLRSQIRKHLWRHGRLVSKQIQEPVEQPVASSSNEADATSADLGESPDSKEPAEQIVTASEGGASTSVGQPSELSDLNRATSEQAGSEQTGSEQTGPEQAGPEQAGSEQPTSEQAGSEQAGSEQAGSEQAGSEQTGSEQAGSEQAGSEQAGSEQTGSEQAGSDQPTSEQPDLAQPTSDQPNEATGDADSVAEVAAGDPPATAKTAAANVETALVPSDGGQQLESATGVSAEPVEQSAETSSTPTPATKEPHPPVVHALKSKKKEVPSRRDQRRETRRRRRERLVQSFKDYFNFSDPIGKVPHHRILAINRGERTKVLRVKVECADWDKFQAEVEQEFVPPTHQHAEFLRKCWQDAMSRLLLPSIEREIRRELNDKAEEHAVKVFARNLRKLLLQPPLTQHRVVAIDPGFRSGCKLIALDEFGQVLGHTFINLVGKEPQKQTGREGLVAFVKQHGATVIAIGNGAACRESEALVAEVLSTELKDQDVAYLIVNEAGTSVYSTSELGREELPDYDATVRGAVSIGRRSLDPLSELVKIDPASIGVGLYQHDVKAKHLRESLDAVVESCVNYVGVDVNSASPALLRYVSGLNALTARRIFEHRQQHGPFRNREQLKDVSGIGELTYVQAAGFLKIADGENPLDGTWIHPESYPIATRVLQAIGYSVNDLRAGVAVEAVSPVGDDTSLATVTPAATPADAVATESASTDSTPAEPATEPVSTSESISQSAAPEAVPSAQEPAADTPAALAAAVSTSEDVVAPTATATVSDAEEPPGSAPAVSAELPPIRAEASVEAATTETAKSVDEAPAPSLPAADVDTGGMAKASAPSARPANGLQLKELAERLATIKVGELAPELGVGKLTLEYILTSLARPGRDPREDLPPPIFRRGILKLEDLKPGMQLAGTVLNVVDFGAFVDIGLVDSGLIHVSRLADKFVSDPHDVVSVGDILRVWVVEVDQKRRRVSLTAIEPGTEKPRQEKVDRSNVGRPSKPRQGIKKKDVRGKRPPRGRRPSSEQYKPKRPPKPVVPITKEMEDGKEPMRTFGDLKQLFDKRKRPDKQ